MTDAKIEQIIQAKGLTAPRITPTDIEANIVHTEIVKHVSQSGQVLRWAVLTARNGFAVTGRPSASVSSENDRAEIGEQVAIENARQELWPLMGYELRSKLAAGVAVNDATKWTVIDPSNPETLPPTGFWLVAVDTDDGREVQVLLHEGNGKWLHEGEYTFQHGYYFRPAAWATRPAAYSGPMPSEA